MRDKSNFMTAVATLRKLAVFQMDTVILEEINLDIAAGEFIYLVGKTGSGKSTLLKTLYGDLPLRSGRAIVAGFDLAKLDRKSIPKLRRQLGIIFQDFNLLYDRSVDANLDFVLRATGWNKKVKRKERISEVLQQVSLADKGDRMPHELSGGEQQRVVIARALLNRPQLIIADEPTGNLDPQTSEEIVQLLRHLSNQHNTAILFATHDYRMLEKYPARTLRCENGQVADQSANVQ